MPIPQQFIDDLVRDADIVGVVGRHVRLTHKGKNHLGLCPFHKEKTPSFNVSPDRGMYHCFGCGASGTALTFLYRYVHANDFQAAIHDLATQMGREVPSDGRRVEKVPLEMLEQMRKFYFGRLLRDDKAKGYLKGRGISKQTAKHYSLGVAPKNGGLAEVFGSLDKHAGDLVRVGLARKGDDGSVWAYFRDRIMFPIISPSGRTQGFGGRATRDDQEPKYLNSPQSQAFDKSRVVYGLGEAADSIRERKRILVVEGYMDVVSLAEHGIGYAVATMGTAATTQQLKAIAMRDVPIVFCFDGDAAGRKAAAKALANLMPVLKDGMSVAFAFLPDGEDPDSYVAAHKAEGLERFLDGASPLEAMLLESPLEDEATDASGKSARWNRIAGLLESMNRKTAPFLYAELYKQLADVSGIEIDELKRAAFRVQQNEHQYRPVEPEPAIEGDRKMKEHSIYWLLLCIHMRPELAAQAQDTPLYDLPRDDLLLFNNFIDRCSAAVRSGAELSVEDYLDSLGRKALILQLQLQAGKWDGKIDPAARFAKLMAELNRQRSYRIEQQKMVSALDEV